MSPFSREPSLRGQRPAGREARSRGFCRGGIAILAALSLLMLVGVLSLALSSLFAADVMRTKDTRAEAQLRQMLTAAGRVAARQVRAAEVGRDTAMLTRETRFELALPDELVDRGGAVSVRGEPVSGGVEVLVHVEAALDGREMRQILRFGESMTGWRLLEARLTSAAEPAAALSPSGDAPR